MNKITQEIFKNYKPNFSKLKNYGFSETNGELFYSCEILDGQFALKIKITENDVQTETIDLLTDEPYTLFLAEGASGSFIGGMRTAYRNVLLDIAEKCFDKCVFKSVNALKIIEYAAEKYGDFPEFLWEKFTDNAVLRRKDNKKWYAALLTVVANKLGLNGNEKTEILDLRAEPETIDKLVDGEHFFRGYHMNKKHWITVLLDGTVPYERIENMLDTSYDLARKSK